MAAGGHGCGSASATVRQQLWPQAAPASPLGLRKLADEGEEETGNYLSGEAVQQRNYKISTITVDTGTDDRLSTAIGHLACPSGNKAVVILSQPQEAAGAAGRPGGIAAAGRGVKEPAADFSYSGLGGQVPPLVPWSASLCSTAFHWRLATADGDGEDVGGNSGESAGEEIDYGDLPALP
ncbi:hypothetical protein N2152v2_006813 [Parachlorella kessleri]